MQQELRGNLYEVKGKFCLSYFPLKQVHPLEIVPPPPFMVTVVIFLYFPSQSIMVTMVYYGDNAHQDKF